jgi:hypothetical protein
MSLTGYPMHKQHKIALYVLGVGLAAALVAEVLVPAAMYSRYIARNCPHYEYDPGFVDQKDFVDCRGYIGIERYRDENVLTVFNGLFPKLKNWDAFRIHSYEISNDKIYYIEDTEIKNSPVYYAVTEWPDVTSTPALYKRRLDLRSRGAFSAVLSPPARLLPINPPPSSPKRHPHQPLCRRPAPVVIQHGSPLEKSACMRRL